MRAQPEAAIGRSELYVGPGVRAEAVDAPMQGVSRSKGYVEVGAGFGAGLYSERVCVCGVAGTAEKDRRERFDGGCAGRALAVVAGVGGFRADMDQVVTGAEISDAILAAVVGLDETDDLVAALAILDSGPQRDDGGERDGIAGIVEDSATYGGEGCQMNEEFVARFGEGDGNAGFLVAEGYESLLAGKESVAARFEAGKLESARRVGLDEAALREQGKLGVAHGDASCAIDDGSGQRKLPASGGSDDGAESYAGNDKADSTQKGSLPENVAG
jgi:hypothetical protein